VGGRKYPERTLVNGVATAETIHVGAAGDSGRDLLVPLISNGEADAAACGHAGTAAAREHHAAAIAELPPAAFSLGRGEPAIPTVYA
jgi:nicotinate phosphoribosyltransferase